MGDPAIDDDIMGAPPVDVGALAPVDETGRPATPSRQTLGRGANRLRQSLHAGAAGAALRFQRTATSVDQQGGLAASLEVFQERHAGGPRRRPPKKRRDPLAASPFAAPVKRPPRPKSAGGASQVAQAIMAKYGRGPPVGGGAAAARPRSADAMSRSAPLLGRPATVVARAVATLGQGTQPTPLQRMRALEMELSLPMRDRKAVTDMVKAAHVAGRVPPRGRERVIRHERSARARSGTRIDAPRDDRSSKNRLK